MIKIMIAILMVVAAAGCTQAPTTVEKEKIVYKNVQIVEFRAMANSTTGETVAMDDSGKWDATVTQEAAPDKDNPADYGMNSDGEYWVDGIITAKTYDLAKDGKIATHTHGIVIYAVDSITIDGKINVRNLGRPGDGYSTTRAGTLALYRGYGETDADTGEPLLWGKGDENCFGGGYVILRAPAIYLNGAVDAGSDCGQPGIIYLEGNVVGNGILNAGMIIYRGY